MNRTGAPSTRDRAHAVRLPAGYRLVDVLHEGPRTRVVRAEETAGGPRRVLKVPVEEFPPRELLLGLRAEADSLSRVRSDHVVGALRYVDEDDYGALVMVDEAAEPLPTFVRRERPEPGRALRVAVQLARAVADVHAAGLVHKDVNPANVLVARGDRAFLCDFSHAAPPVREGGSPRRGGALEGTLPYLSPEQTGRVALAVDFRSDVAGLGATLFFLFTGRPPHEGDDPASLLHAVLARTPPPLREVEPRVPGPLSEAVGLALRKAPEERYQSALALHGDLALCLEALERNGEVPDDLAMGGKGLSPFLSFGDVPFGRAEARVALDAFVGSVEGGEAASLALVGEPGSGKSMLARTLARRLGGCLLAQGGWEETRAGAASALGSALAHALEFRLSSLPSALEAWLDSLRHALGANGEPVADFVPGLAALLGREPRPSGKADSPAPGGSAAAGATDASGDSEGIRRLLRYGVEALVSRLASRREPLVLLLDDLQWADPLALEILGDWLEGSRPPDLHLVLAWRPGTEADARLARIARALAGRTAMLDPLLPEDVDALVSFVTKVPPSACADLGSHVYAASQGNPLAARETLLALVDSGRLVPDHAAARWRWDAEALARPVPRLSPSREALDARLELLPPPVRAVLGAASVLGASFGLPRLLTLLDGAPDADTFEALRLAVARGFLVTIRGPAAFLALRAPPDEGWSAALARLELGFAHDLVREACGRSLGEERALDLHHKAAIALDEALNAGDDAVHDAARDAARDAYALHAVRALPRLDARARGVLLARLREAGVRALARASYAHAAWCLAHAEDLAGAVAWEEDRSAAWAHAFARYRAECLVRSRPLAELDALFDTLVARAVGFGERSLLLEAKASSEIARRSFDRALVTLRLALADAGIALPRRPGVGGFLWEAGKTKLLLRGVRESDFRSLPALSDPRIGRALHLLMAMTAPAYFVEPDLFPVLVCRMLRLTARHGMGPVGAYALAVWGVLECAAFGRIREGYALGGLGYALGDAVRGNPLAGKTIMVFNTSVRHWKDPIALSLPEFVRGHRAALEAGDFEYAALNALAYVAYSFVSGVELARVEERARLYSRVVSSLKEESHAPLIAFFGQLALDLRAPRDPGATPSARPAEPWRVEGSLFPAERASALAAAGDKASLAILATFRMQACYLLGASEEALRYAREARALQSAIVGTAYQVVFTFYHGLTLLDAAPGSRVARRVARREARREARACARKLRRWALLGPANTEHKALLLEGGIAALEGRHGDALERYELAASRAAASGYGQEEALACERAGRMLAARGGRKLAGRFLKDAVAAWERWGARARCDALRVEFPTLLAGSAASTWLPAGGLAQPHDGTANAAGSTLSLSNEHARTLVERSFLRKAAETLRELRVAREVAARFVAILVEGAGAERAVLFLSDGDALRVAADSRTDGPPPDGDPALPVAFANAARNGGVLVIDDARTDPHWQDHPYVRASRARSVLCIPLSRTDGISGVAFLENSALPGAFSSELIDAVTVLSGQALASIHNARLLEELEARVDARTAELRSALGRLSRAQEELVRSEKLAALGTLVAGVSHEVNTPLGVAVLVASRLKHDHGVFEEAMRVGLKKSDLVAYSGAVRESIGLLEGNLAVVTRLLDQFKSLQTASDVEPTARVDLGELLEGVVAGWRLTDARKGILVEVRAPERVVIPSHPTALLQVLYNLIKNACTHAFDPDTPDARVELSLAVASTDSPDGTVTISCSDNGRGIEPALLGRIYDPFFTTNRGGGNLGLGLALVHGLVTGRLRGRLRCESVPGRGTAFHVELPLSPGAFKETT